MENKEKRIVVPGEEVIQGMDHVPGHGTYRDGEKIIAAQLGVLSESGRALKVIPLSGRYVPKIGDTIIGEVNNILFGGWMVDFGFVNEGMVSLKEGSSDYIERGADLSKYYSFGDIVAAKVSNTTRFTSTDLTMKGPGLRKLTGGKIIKIASSKVPRVIGKQGSMITMIKEKTGCNITVGQNGWIWLSGKTSDDEMTATNAILTIEEKSHISGLTDEISKLLGGQK